MASTDGHAGGARKRLRTEAAGPPQQPMEDEAAVAAAVARLAHLGCVFDEDGVLRNAQDKTKPFEFDFFNGDHARNQERYDQIADAVLEYIQAQLVAKYNCERVRVPLVDEPAGTPEEPQSYVYISRDLETNTKRLLLVIQGSGAVRPGIWSRAALINGNIMVGSIFPYLDAAVAAGASFIIFNPNQTTDKGRPIRGNESPLAHGRYVWSRFVSRSPAERVDIVAHSYGGVVTSDLASDCDVGEGVRARVQRVAFTDAVHSVERLPAIVQDWIYHHAINWVKSDDPLDTWISRTRGRGSGCLRLSAGHRKHEYTSGYCLTSAVAWLFEGRNYLAIEDVQ